ncbi:hypothetical protein B0T24DRAFT_184917 [Lasiosphaeria ovina]|uniref:Uncharacterized protein n=1 Tax=Lasiosphaeria ovina TaxID=92902 RepID=A0AAE0TTU4_9PEZI|nr:hypothetical protein B0T24DRAFT_184917 [Lasiosphaeria ovina]
MRLTTLQAALGSASIFFLAHPASAVHHGHQQAHENYGRSQSHNPEAGGPKLVKKGTCTLPKDSTDLVFVPGASNNGFAMSPDQTCDSGKYCPIACVSGKVMRQWDPKASYVYPESMNGGLYCDNGTPKKPFDGEPYCVSGTGTVKAVNKCGKIVSFCQTVLPGNEAMIIPNDVSSTLTLAVPSIDYWNGSAAHYYINPPGTPSSVGCVWGDPSQPIGNWSPYVAGANTDAEGRTFLKIAWNPIYTGCELAKTKPSYGVKIECPNGGCNGLPCSINPSTDGVNGLESPVGTVGVGAATFCVVTVPKGGVGNIVVFNTDGSGGDSAPEPPKSSVQPSPPPKTSSSTTPPPKTSTTPSTTAATSSKAPTTSAEAESEAPSSSASPTSSFRYGGIFHENSTSTASEAEDSSSHGTTTGAALTAATDIVAPVSTTSKNEGAADQRGAAMAGLVIALVAAAAMY